MLDVNGISKTFNPGTVNEKKALSELSLHLDRGDFVTVIGSNGAGKSTLLNAVAGSFYVDAGSISLGGRDITFLPEHKRSRTIGRLFQDPLKGTAPHMTIEENLALAYLRSSRRKLINAAECDLFIRDRNVYSHEIAFGEKSTDRLGSQLREAVIIPAEKRMYLF